MLQESKQSTSKSWQIYEQHEASEAIGGAPRQKGPPMGVRTTVLYLASQMLFKNSATLRRQVEHLVMSLPKNCYVQIVR